ncbi:HD domain-containing protein [Tenacibaculum agarivorans]|uniref:HD domain-containing protein n=1 Tax=Tenacibaculum agarivorans TaxID=1908389 RepID=UPI00094B9571|nr:HD domain-containing protein [Tenacibaculum agarivorans]
MKIVELSKEIRNLLEQFDAPQRLIKHLTIVNSTALHIVEQLNTEWPNLELNKKEILFGASTHDIGKAVITDELYKKGKKHESKGFEILKELGYNDEESRFTITHGNWENQGLKIEDLIVCLSDKIWKGKRVNELEERITNEISELTKTDFWDVSMKFELILEKIAIGSDDRIAWQGI